MYDEDAIFELGEQIKQVVDEMASLVWETTHDMDLWRRMCDIRFGRTDPARKGVEDCVDAIFEEVGIEFCEECGERVEGCTCEDEVEEDETEAAEVEA